MGILSHIWTARRTHITTFLVLGVFTIALVLLSRLATAASSSRDQQIPAGLAAHDWRNIQTLLATQTGYFKASNTEAGDGFGWSVAVDGDTVVIGVFREDSNGSSPGDNSATSAGAALTTISQLLLERQPRDYLSTLV